MKKIIPLCFLLTGCGCPVDIGDELFDTRTSKYVRVLGIESWGSATHNCRIYVKDKAGQVEGPEHAFIYKKL